MLIREVGEWKLRMQIAKSEATKHLQHDGREERYTQKLQGGRLGWHVGFPM